jgi:hypothetical protein
MKREWIIFSIVWSFLSLIFSILVYFGLIRYINLYIYNPRSYIKNYHLLERAINDKKIVIHLTITNIDKLKPVINSLLDQTVKVDEITISVVNKLKLPEYMKDLKSVVRTYNTPHSSKLCIMRETDNNTIIIFINDDKIYGKDFIQDLVEMSEKNKNESIKISNDGEILTNPGFFSIDCLDDDFDIKDYIKNKNFKNINYTENYKKI